MEIHSKQMKKGHTYFQWIFAVLSNFILLLYGMDCGWVSPIAKYLQSDTSPTGYSMSDDEIAWIASTPSMAAIFGVSLCAFVADQYGRKTSIILIAALNAISWIIRLLYSSFITLVIARVFAGLGAGGCFGVVPMYIKEISQEDLRGVLGILPTLFQTLGIFIIYVTGAYFDYYTVIYAVLALPLLTILLMIKAPESPEFLVQQDKIVEATRTVEFLRGLENNDSTAQGIVEMMTKQEAHFKSLPNITLLSIFKNASWRRGILHSILAILFFEANGAYAIITYASAILSSTGVDFGINPEIQTFSFPIMMILGSLALAFCVGKFGRKIRAKVMGLLVTFNWLFGFIFLRIYTPLASLGVYVPFIFYGSINLAGALFTIFHLTETKGKTEEEILQTLGVGKKIKSAS